MNKDWKTVLADENYTRCQALQRYNQKEAVSKELSIIVFGAILGGLSVSVLWLFIVFGN